MKQSLLVNWFFSHKEIQAKKEEEKRRKLLIPKSLVNPLWNLYKNNKGIKHFLQILV